MKCTSADGAIQHLHRHTKATQKMEEDPFWLVQLTDNSETTLFVEEAPRGEYEV